MAGNFTMPHELDTTEVDMNGLCVLHLLRTRLGFMFSMSELAVELFKENPGAFIKDIRSGRYKRFHVTDEDVMLRLAQLQIPPESITVPGATLLPSDTVEALLRDRRKAELVEVVRLALLKVVSADAAKLLAQGLFEECLPVAIDAINKGKVLYYPEYKLQLVPVYLLGAQANLGLGRAVQAEDMLGIAAWLLIEDKSDEDKIAIRAEITRIFGVLYYLEGEKYKSKRCSNVVVEWWLDALKEVVLGIPYKRLTPWETPQYPGREPEMENFKTQMERMYFKEVTDMLQVVSAPCPLASKSFRVLDVPVGVTLSLPAQEISVFRSSSEGEGASVAEVCLVLGLAFTHSRMYVLAREHLEHAADLCGSEDQETLVLINSCLKLIPKPAIHVPMPLQKSR
ncbi:hypothetical protein AXG93_1200s1610 [Marchantia polymorpha subsp. ruderalis]|uniref:Uncharacterized protein n=1 Tax=Marchantia polymorpha subsp. ruderalis TaxID=1480154 RepID=A0A176WJT4_MARPO|nr:hypothetical protein AXG93_1200s1610 [Marchantia polymorpha subsp. ruderalis]